MIQIRKSFLSQNIFFYDNCNDDDVGRENSGFQSAEFQENDRDIRAAPHKCIAFNCNTLQATASHYFELQPTVQFQCKDLLKTAH